MRIYQNLSIRSKLIGIILLVTILTLGIGFSIDINHDIKTFKKDMVNHSVVTAKVVGDYCSGALLFNERDGAKKILEKLTAVPAISNAVVYNTEGEVFASLNELNEILISPPELKTFSSQFRGNYLHVFQPIFYNNEYYGMIYLCTATELLTEKIMDHLKNMFWLIAGLIAISFFFAIRFQRIISKPILHLADVAKQIAKEENYSIRVQKTGNDETGVLYDGFNNMLKQIHDREIEREKAEQTLKKSNEQLNIFRKFAEASGQGMGIADLAMNITYANPALCNILDEENQQKMLGKNVEFYYPDEFRNKLKEEVIQTVIADDQWIGELPLLSHKGKFIPCIQGVFLLRDDDGKPINIANIITDITERKRAEQELAKYRDHLQELVETRTAELTEANRQLQNEIEERKQVEYALRESEASLANAQRIAHLGNWDWNIVKNELHWSDEIFRIFGLKPREFDVTYDAFLNYIHPDDIEFVKKSVNDALTKKKPYSIDHRIVRPDGSELIVHEHGEVFFDDTNKPIRMSGTVQDITEHKKAEEELKNTQAQLAQSEKMAALGTLVAGVAHEINTPVGAINSMYNTLMRAVEKLKCIINTTYSEDQKEIQKVDRLFKIIEDANQVIASGTNRVTNIVRRLKSFARLDEAELLEVDIHEGIEDTLVIVHHELKHKAVVERNYGNIPPISCYPSQLNQVYLNLLVNAIQAIEDKGKITISTFQKSDKIYIQFKDTGVGIPKDSLNKIFDPGYTTKGVGVGTGLGLSICYQIVRDHHGKIMVESEVGKGSTFTIILPKTPRDRFIEGRTKNNQTISS